jgi:hypothetical protein
MRWWLFNGRMWASESMPIAPLVVCNTDLFIRWIEGADTFDNVAIDPNGRHSLAAG